MNRAHVVWLVVATLLAAACSSAGGGGGGSANANSYAGKTLQLGAVLSLTGASGVYGLQSRNGATLAVEQINASGGINGARISLTVLDDKSDKTTSAAQAKTLIEQDKVLAFLGPTLSSSAVAVHPLAESLRTPVLAVSTNGTHIVPDCNFPDQTPCRYVFRDSLGEETAIPDNIKSYVNDAHPKTGVLLAAQDDEASREDAKIVQNTVGQLNIKLLKTITFSMNDANVSRYATQAVQLNSDVIFIMSTGAIQAQMMIEARNEGWQGVFLGGGDFNTAAVSKQAGAAGRGARTASAWYLGNTLASNRDFVAAYRNAYNTDPDQLAAQGYTGIRILADAARRANLSFTDLAGDRDKIRAALEKVNIDTPLGRFEFTANHDVRQTVWIIEMDGAGGFTLDHAVSPS